MCDWLFFVPSESLRAFVHGFTTEFETLQLKPEEPWRAESRDDNKLSHKVAQAAFPCEPAGLPRGAKKGRVHFREHHMES